MGRRTEPGGGNVFAGCQPTPTGRTFQVTLRTAPHDPLPVALIDQTGLVTGIVQPVDPPSSVEPALRADPTDENAATLTWTGGVCDADITVTFLVLDGGYVMNLTARERPGSGCPLAGVPRAIRISTSEPIPIGSVTVAVRLRTSGAPIDGPPEIGVDNSRRINAY